MKIAYAKLARSFPTARSAVSNVGGDIEVVNLLHHLLDDGHEVHLIGQTQKQHKCDHPRADELLVNYWGEGDDYLFDRRDFRRLMEVATRKNDQTLWDYEEWLDTAIDQFPEFDDVLVWLGHHGTSLHPLPGIRKKGEYTICQQNDLRYSYPIVRAINRKKWQPMYLCPDPRNRMKFRDFSHKQERKVVAQFNESKEFKGWDPDYEGPGGTKGRVFTMRSYYRYDGIETLAIDHMLESRGEKVVLLPWENREGPLLNPPDSPFGLIVNEGYPYVNKDKRLVLVQTWCTPWMQREDFELFGTWSAKSTSELQSNMHKDALCVEPIPYEEVIDRMSGWRSTFTMPATATGWATAKPWEAFIAGCVCFRHPRYDRQNHIYSATKMPGDLAQFLSPLSPRTLETRVDEMWNDKEAWAQRAGQQFQFLKENYERGWHAVRERLGKVSL